MGETARAGNGVDRERREAGNDIGHIECKAENGKGPGATLSTRGASCQGESLIGYLHNKKKGLLLRFLSWIYFGFR